MDRVSMDQSIDWSMDMSGFLDGAKFSAAKDEFCQCSDIPEYGDDLKVRLPSFALIEASSRSDIQL